MEMLLTELGLRVARQHPIAIHFRGREQLGFYRCDMIVEAKVLWRSSRASSSLRWPNASSAITSLRPAWSSGCACISASRTLYPGAPVAPKVRDRASSAKKRNPVTSVTGS